MFGFMLAQQGIYNLRYYAYCYPYLGIAHETNPSPMSPLQTLLGRRGLPQGRPGHIRVPLSRDRPGDQGTHLEEERMMRA